MLKKSIFSKAPRLTSANIDGKQTNQNSSVDGYMELAHGPHLLLSKTRAKCNVLHPLHITPPMMWTWAVWSFEWFHPKSVCHYCTFCAVCVPKFVSVCVCVHTFLSICSSPSVLSQCLHPNHNYNVISRVRQCPHCCFTFSSSSLLWISNALMLSSESCTALSPTHTCVYVCFRGGWVVG